MKIVTKQFIKDLKESHSIVMRFNGKYSTIDMFTDNNPGGRHVTHEFNGENFGYTGNWYTSVYYNSSGNVLNTFIKSLRVGDKLKFYVENHQTESLKDAGFFSYQLNAQITRYKKNSESISSINHYSIDSQTCLDNSALNIRPDAGTLENNIYSFNR